MNGARKPLRWLETGWFFIGRGTRCLETCDGLVLWTTVPITLGDNEKERCRIRTRLVQLGYDPQKLRDRSCELEVLLR